MSETQIAALSVRLGADVSDYEKKMAATWKAAEKSMDKLKDFGKDMSLYVTAPILAAATAITVWAAEEETADARTASSLRNVGVSYDKVTDQLHSYISGLEKISGFEDTSLQNSFTNLVNITGSAKTSMMALSVVTDVAAGTGRDLETVSTAVGRALDGTDTALKRMGISLQANMSPTEILAALMNKFGGTAARVAQTVQGKWDQIKNGFANVAETVGHSLEPITKQIEDFVLKLIGWGQQAATFFAQQPEGVKKVTVAFFGLLAAIGPLLVALATLGGAILTVGGAIAAGGGWAAVTGTLSAIGTAAWAALAPFLAWPAAIAAVAATFAIFYANGNKLAAGLGGIFFVLAQSFSNWIGGLLNDLGSLASVIPGFGDKISKALTDAGQSALSFGKMSGEAAQELATDYENAGGYVDNTANLMKGVFADLASSVGLNLTAVNTAIQSTGPNLNNMGSDLDVNVKKWKDWAAGLKVTVQDLATGIYQAMSGAVTGITDVLVSGSGDWKGVLLQFLKASLAATTAWAIAKMTIFQNMSEALAAAISGPWGWLIIGGLIAATIAVGQSSIPAMANGGMTQGQGIFTMGDNPSGQEIALPLDSPQTTNALAKAMPQGGGAGEQTIIVYLGDEEVARAVVRGMPGVLRLSGVANA